MTLGPDGNLYGATEDSTVVAYVIPGYGTIYIPSGSGTIYKVTTNGILTTLVDFDFNPGGNPVGSLTLGPDGNFYSTTYLGGDNNMGIVYSMTTNGTLAVVDNFNGTNGAYPIAGLTLGPDNNLYGATAGGGVNTAGAFFKVNLLPSFISNPVSQSVIIGNSTSFSCSLFGTPPFAFQWLSNSVPISGETGGSLYLSRVFYQANNTQIQVVVTNSYGSVTSQVANLSVVLQPNCATVVNLGGGSYNVVVGSYLNTLNHLWATTNLSLPSSWQQIAPITTDANGKGQYLDTDPATREVLPSVLPLTHAESSLPAYPDRPAPGFLGVFSNCRRSAPVLGRSDAPSIQPFETIGNRQGSAVAAAEDGRAPYFENTSGADLRPPKFISPSWRTLCSLRAC